jgi:hypothetical protein
VLEGAVVLGELLDVGGTAGWTGSEPGDSVEPLTVIAPALGAWMRDEGALAVIGDGPLATPRAIAGAALMRRGTEADGGEMLGGEDAAMVV